MTDSLFSAARAAAPSRAGYRLERLEVYNWGTFDGQIWHLDPGRDTALLTGDIGSGKSTLVDAITTLLLPAHRIGYNKAAGAGAKERTLRSYVEGHYKSERSEASGRSKSIGLRMGGRSYSVILGRFTNEGYDETVTIAQVFQQRDQSGQPYRFYVTAPRALTVADDFANFGSSLNDLRRRLRAADVAIYDEYPKYAKAARRLLGITSEQALELFHQTVSMKSVGNLDDFVRDHMLEPADATDKVAGIIGHFENLTTAHDAVIRAREQLEALTPITIAAAQYDVSAATRTAAETESAAVALHVAELRAGLLDKEIAALQAEGESLTVRLDAAEALSKTLAEERDGLIAARAVAGGDRIGELERLAVAARDEADRRRAARARFDAAVNESGLPPVTDAAGLADLTVVAAGERERLMTRQQACRTEFADSIGTEKRLEAEVTALRTELASLESRTSNLPPAQVDIRQQLCEDTGIAADELPYAGELIDVADQHAPWRGAAERVLHSFALSLLVPQRHYEAVTAWVNARRLEVRGPGGRRVGAKLVFERVPERRVAVAYPAHDGLQLADCIEVRPGPLADYVVGELARRADFFCADTLEEFRASRRAVTRQGQVRSAERHEKDDRHRVDDPRRWVLGWANEHKIAAVTRELAAVERAHTEAATVSANLADERDRLQAALGAVARLGEFTAWTDLDADEAEARAADYDAERQRLSSGSSELAEITAALERHEITAADNAAAIKELAGRLATAARDLHAAEQLRDADLATIAACPDAELTAARAVYPALAARLGPTVPTRARDCAEVERTLNLMLHREIEQHSKELTTVGQRLVALMGAVLSKWRELEADMDASVDSRADFVALANRIESDDLPRFEADFKEQLNRNAIQELAAFNNWLMRQAAGIDERVARINEGLRAVPYNPGRIIRLEKEPTHSVDVMSFRKDLRDLTDDALAVDGDHYSQQRFMDVKRIIERFRGREGSADSDRAWTRRVTDVRNWFVFSASERDEITDVEWEHYSDSDGKSGGQKEKLAYTILAASLAYQFGLTWGAKKSRDFRFAVIDEAFGRGSDASTRYALELFAALGLQLLVVTPLQKVHVIEPYVRAIGFVDNVTGTASRVHTMTIEEYRERKAQP